MKFLILGDTHGDWTAMNITIAKAIRKHPDITHIVQVGDFGYGWRGGKPFKASKALLTPELMKIYKKAEKFWLDGNHENFDKLEEDGGAWQPEWQYMPRGSVLEIPREDGSAVRAMFFGGASSIDKASRIQNISWWPQESITYAQMYNTLQAVSGPIDAIFSHEHPMSFPYSDVRYQGSIFGSSDKNFLEVLKEKYRPKFWFFGHHHEEDTGLVDSTRWFCCPVIDYFKYVIWTGDEVFLDS